MSLSLRDQLLGLGYTAPVPEPRPTRQDRDVRPRGQESGARPVVRNEMKSDARPANRRDSKPGERTPRGRRDQERRGAPQAKPAGAVRTDIDLGKAFALRAQREKEERIAAERERQEAAQRKREAKARIVELIEGKTRNDPSAEIARHFEYKGKIRRVHVTPEQLRAVNAGELGVVQLDGRYMLFDTDIVEQVRALLPGVIALMVVPGDTGDDPYADPLYRVPDDLVW